MTIYKKWQALVDSPVVLGLVIFVLALIPRVLNPGVFVAPDEWLWVFGTSGFEQGLVTGKLEQTYFIGHSGVMLMWVGTLVTWLRFVIEGVNDGADWAAINRDGALETLTYYRLSVAIINASLLSLSAVVTRRLFGSGAAWLAGILIAFDPFVLTEARVFRPEGLLVSFSSLALLVLLLYLETPSIRSCMIAGALIGLALLSKASAAPLLVVGGLIIGGRSLLEPTHPPNERLRRAIVRLLVLAGTILLTVTLLWPALWTGPFKVMGQLYQDLLTEVSNEGRSTFFLGRAYRFEDLSPLFYLVVLPFRTGPVLWLGLVLLGLTVWRAKPPLSRQRKIALGIMVLYLVIFLALITGSVQKYDRYTMPMMPIINIMAALGFVIAWQWLSNRSPRLAPWGGPFVLLVLIAQIALAWPHHPYYYTYYNPLLGGLKQAVHTLPVGQGEGMDQVAAYLNALPDADTLTVALSNPSGLDWLFKGQTLRKSNYVDGDWFTADYTFVYISDRQDLRYDPEFSRYLEHLPREFLLTMSGVDYGWLYRGPGAQFLAGDSKLEGRATLHAYDLNTTLPNPGQTVTATVHFRNEGQRPSDNFYVRLVDDAGFIWAENTVRPSPGFEATFGRTGALVEGEAALRLPVGIPPGPYVLKMGYDDAQTGQRIGEFELPAEADDIIVNLPAEFPSLGSLNPPKRLDLTLFDELNLVGYELNTNQLAPGETARLTLYWQALTNVMSDYVLTVELVDAANSEGPRWQGRPVHNKWPTYTWQAQQIIQDPWQLDLPDDLRPGDYKLTLTLDEAETDLQVSRLTLDTLSILERRRQFELPKMQHNTHVDLGDRFTLLGYDLVTALVPGGGRLDLTLYWQLQARETDSYLVFVELIGPDGSLVAEHEGIPVSGTLPTNEWQVGEVVTDRHPLEFFQTLRPGEYKLLAGIVDPTTGQRLAASNGDTAILLQTSFLK